MDDFNSLKNIILHIKKEKKINSKPKTKQKFSSSPPKVKQVWLRKDKPKCNVMLTALRARAPSEWYFDSGCSRYKLSSLPLRTLMEEMSLLGMVMLPK